jgi:cytokinin dehydrogenase
MPPPEPRRDKIVRLIIERSTAELTPAAEDFGHVLRGTPTGIVRPRSVEDVVEIVAKARSEGYRLTLRGFGHSAGGQALPADSVVVDLTEMTALDSLGANGTTITCAPGVPLRQVVAATIEDGLLPRTLTNLLDLTVGGLLSVGGIGPGAHRFGPIIANIATLTVVTGDGVVRHCSRVENRDLYDAVLGGLGLCGVVVSAKLELRPVQPNVRTYYLLYDDVRHWIEDQRTLAHIEGVTAMEGFCSPSAQGLRGVGGRRIPFAEWFFPLQVSFEFNGSAPELPQRISPYRTLHVEDDEIGHFPARHDLRIETIRRVGGWERAHPYIGALIDADALAEVLPEVLGTLPLAEGHRGTFFVAADAVPPLMALPDSENVVFFAVMYPQVLSPVLADTLEASQRAADLLTEVGGKRYVADWLGEPGDFDWSAHLGTCHERWLESKRAFDPDEVFCSLLLPALG